MTAVTAKAPKQKKHVPANNYIKRSTGDKIFDTANVIVMFLLLLFFLYPVLNVVSISMSAERYVLAADVTFYPKGFDPQAYNAIFSDPDMWNSMFNTIFIAGVGCVLSLIGCCIAAYPIAYGDFYGKKLYTYIIIFTMWFQAGIVPLFLNIQGLGLYNSPWALILNGLITAYNVTIIRSYFQSIPFSIIESARIDGAGDYRILLQFIIPLSKPVLATVALWIIVGHWNDYLNPLILLSDQKKETLQLFLKRLVLSSETSTSNLASANAANNKGVAALSQQLKNGVLVVSMVPMIILYPFLQKFFVSGVTLGAVKG
ncbi:MAG: carbohydrate ABC transporter permease [Clostridia bacterium]|nr:carbohydrate ABC transporter permease [Clostridia bacterium]